MAIKMWLLMIVLFGCVAFLIVLLTVVWKKKLPVVPNRRPDTVTRILIGTHRRCPDCGRYFVDSKPPRTRCPYCHVKFSYRNDG